MSLAGAGRHIVVVEAYDGLAELLTDELDERLLARGLGLPLAELAACLDARVTVLCWDEWVQLERLGASFTSWMPVPATKSPVPPADLSHVAHPLTPPDTDDGSGRLRRLTVPARDPSHARPIAVAGLSTLSHGLLANSDPLFLFSYALNLELSRVHREDPIALVIVPMFGGLGYVPQVARATGTDGAVDAPFVVVVTDSSAARQAANQEGMWSRPALTRRQSEDLSLALADGVIAFGPRGAALAGRGRLADAAEPTVAPRFVPDVLLDRVAAAESRRAAGDAPVAPFLYEPQQPASGALVALDAVSRLRATGSRLERALVSAGPPMLFAPMAPKTFEEYWSARGFVRELVGDGQWQWQRERPQANGALALRLYPSLFEHLPDVWSELARGSCVLLSHAAAEGLAPDERILPQCLVPGAPDADSLARRIKAVLDLGTPALDDARRALCRAVLRAHRGARRAQLLNATAGVLSSLIEAPPPRQELGRVARLLLDRRVPLRESVATTPAPASGTPDKLTVIVTCYNMGAMLEETVRSVWRSDRVPDELLVVDDGSSDGETMAAISRLEDEAHHQSAPLSVIRQENQGLAAARNAGLEAASGTFVSFLDGDDIIDPAFYRIALPLLARNPALGGVAAWSHCFGENGWEGFWNAPQPEFPLLWTENTVFVPCLTRTALLRELGGYDERLRYNFEDWELSCRMLAAGWPIITIPAYLQRYRVRQGSLLRTMTHVQNQVMRELFMERHRQSASRFGVEIAMLVEERLMKHVSQTQWAAAGTNGGGTPALRRISGALRHLLHSATGRLRRRPS